MCRDPPPPVPHYTRVVTRRQLLLATAAAPVAKTLRAQTAFPGVSYRDYSRCLPDYLTDLAGNAYRARNRDLAKLTTPDAIRKRQAWARDTFWKLAGGMPERTPLNARTHGSFERDGYRVEKILYESRPRFHIPADLYIPTKTQPPFPGVLFQMGHTMNGKAGDTYQRCCQGLAKLGYLVLAFDPMGQGERIYYPDQSLRRTRLSSADEEHTHPGKQMLLLGDTSTRLQTWDAVRSLDYLAAHPMVDAKRLASTGQSGGAHPDHVAARGGRPSRRGGGVQREHGEPGLRQLQSSGLDRRRRAGFNRLRAERLRPLGRLLSIRAQTPADRRQRQGLLRHLLSQLYFERLGGVSEAAQGLRKAGACGQPRLDRHAPAARPLLRQPPERVQLLRTSSQGRQAAHYRRSGGCGGIR